MEISRILKESLPKTTERVSRHTTNYRNRKIWQRLEKSVRYYADHPREIDKRLDQLDREWDIERVLETFAAAAVLSGVGLSLRNKRFLIVPGAVAVTLMQHAIQGWCPPVPLLRRLGIRTQMEIQTERHSLKALKEAFTDLEERLETAAEKAAAEKPVKIKIAGEKS
jgi:hypothetical protein